MTEEEWVASKDPVAMAAAAVASARATPRALRLLLAAFWGWQAPRLRSLDARDRLRKRVDLVERWAEEGTAPPEATEDFAASRVVFFEQDGKEAVTRTANAPNGWGKRGQPAIKRVVLLLREVFGPLPFRSVAVDPQWWTSTVLQLAAGIYDERAFDRMPILADALQDAGCEDEDVLTHLRDAKQVHARGCWALDLVLGKE